MTPTQTKKSIILPSTPPSALIPTPQLPALTPQHTTFGITPEYTIGEFRSVLDQNKDLKAKLTVMKPLLRELGLDLDLTETKQQTQIVVHMAPNASTAPLAARFDIIPPTSTKNTPQATLDPLDDE